MMRATSNIGTIKGGQATNIVADNVEILAKLRSLSDEKLHAESDKIKTTFEETAELGGSADVQVDIMYPSLHAPKEDPVITTAAEAIKNIGRESDIIQSRRWKRRQPLTVYRQQF